MILETEKKLKRRKPMTTTSATTAVITVLSLTVIIMTSMTFINLPQSSFAQTATTTNANQTSEVQSQTKGVITPCKVTESTLQGPEYIAEPPFREGQDFAKGIEGERLVVSGKVLNVMTCKPVQGVY